MEVGKFAFELHVIVGCARDIARAARAGSHGVNRLVHGCYHRWVLAHAEIIVGAPHRNLARAICREMICHRKEPAAALQIRENAISTFSMKGSRAAAGASPQNSCRSPARLSGKNAEQSFGLQAELDRRGRNLARCCRVVLEDLERLAERCCRDLSLTKHNSRAHQASPALDVSRRTLQAICQAIDHRSDCSVTLVRRHRFGLGVLLGAWSVTALADGPGLQRRGRLCAVLSEAFALASSYERLSSAELGSSSTAFA